MAEKILVVDAAPDVAATIADMLRNDGDLLATVTLAWGPTSSR